MAEWIWWSEDASGEPSRYVPALEWLCRPMAGRKPASAHAIVEPLGTVHLICDADKVAWHAGRSRFGDEVNLNKVSLGVEVLVRGRHDYIGSRRAEIRALGLGYDGSFIDAIKRPDCYSNLQYKALAWLVHHWMTEHHRITFDRIVGHSRIAGDDVRGGGRGKRDPGDGFDWHRLWDEVDRWANHTTR